MDACVVLWLDNWIGADVDSLVVLGLGSCCYRSRWSWLCELMRWAIAPQYRVLSPSCAADAFVVFLHEIIDCEFSSVRLDFQSHDELYGVSKYIHWLIQACNYFILYFNVYKRSSTIF